MSSENWISPRVHSSSWSLKSNFNRNKALAGPRRYPPRVTRPRALIRRHIKSLELHSILTQPYLNYHFSVKTGIYSNCRIDLPCQTSIGRFREIIMAWNDAPGGTGTHILQAPYRVNTIESSINLIFQSNSLMGRVFVTASRRNPTWSKKLVAPR